MWESNNQGVKKETFIQIGRRGGDRQLGGEDSHQGGGQRIRVGRVAAGGPGEAADCGPDGPTFTCICTGRNN